MLITYGDQFSIGPRRLYAEWSGAGTPVIVLDAGGRGAGCWNGAWAPIWNELAALATVCRYDRANTGRSEAAATPRTGQDMVADLRLLLGAAGFPPPYLLVGHSFGGLVMQLYARLHPDEVAGLALSDSVHPDQIERFYTVSKEAGDELRTEIKDVLVGIDWAGSAAQLRQAPPLAEMPFVVISRGRETPVAAAWSALQADLAAQLPTGRQVIAHNSGHSIPFDEPQVVIRAIENLLPAARARALALAHAASDSARAG